MKPEIIFPLGAVVFAVVFIGAVTRKCYTLWKSRKHRGPYWLRQFKNRDLP